MPDEGNRRQAYEVIIVDKLRQALKLLVKWGEKRGMIFVLLTYTNQLLT